MKETMENTNKSAHEHLFEPKTVRAVVYSSDFKPGDWTNLHTYPSRLTSSGPTPVSLKEGDRVLFIDNLAKNGGTTSGGVVPTGIYLLTTDGWAVARDLDGEPEYTPGTYVAIEQNVDGKKHHTVYHKSPKGGSTYPNGVALYNYDVINIGDADWNRILNKPRVFPTEWESVQNRPVTYPSDWDTLKDKPELFSGKWADLRGKPELFSGEWADLRGKPEVFSGKWVDLKDKPEVFSGKWADLKDKPEVFPSAKPTWGEVADKPNSLVELAAADLLYHYTHRGNLQYTPTDTWGSLFGDSAKLGAGTYSLEISDVLPTALELPFARSLANGGRALLLEVLFHEAGGAPASRRVRLTLSFNEGANNGVLMARHSVRKWTADIDVSGPATARVYSFSGWKALANAEQSLAYRALPAVARAAVVDFNSPEYMKPGTYSLSRLDTDGPEEARCQFDNAPVPKLKWSHQSNFGLSGFMTVIEIEPMSHSLASGGDNCFVKQVFYEEKLHAGVWTRTVEANYTTRAFVRVVSDWVALEAPHGHRLRGLMDHTTAFTESMEPGAYLIASAPAGSVLAGQLPNFSGFEPAAGYLLVERVYRGGVSNYDLKLTYYDRERGLEYVKHRSMDEPFTDPSWSLIYQDQASGSERVQSAFFYKIDLTKHDHESVHPVIFHAGERVGTLNTTGANRVEFSHAQSRDLDATKLGLGLPGTRNPDYNLVIEMGRPVQRGGQASWLRVDSYSSKFGLGVCNLRAHIQGSVSATDATPAPKRAGWWSSVHLRGGLVHQVRSEYPLRIMTLGVGEASRAVSTTPGDTEYGVFRPFKLDRLDNVAGQPEYGVVNSIPLISPDNSAITISGTVVSKSEPPAGDWGHDGITDWVVVA